MDPNRAAQSLILAEVRSLETRLDGVMPFSLHMTMVGAASASRRAHLAIQRHMDREIQRLRRGIASFLEALDTGLAPADAQRRLSFLKLRFNVVLSHFDIYSDVLVQRSEHVHGVQLAGLDALAGDALNIPGYGDEIPPVLCYLDRGQGAAIRRARTRLPGGGDNPVALIRVPRERMIGSGIGSSLVHEVGHQVAALLDLVSPLRRRLVAKAHGNALSPWAALERWISEIVADFWSILKLGVTSTLGLIGVVSLPNAFVFRIGLDDPHPFPWLRVQLSCAIGGALYPDREWPLLAAAWEQLYPLSSQSDENQQFIADLLDTVPAFVELLLGFRPPALAGRALVDLVDPELTPTSLRALGSAFRSRAAELRPVTAVATIGQARFEGRLSATREAGLLRGLLVDWALRRFNGPLASETRLRTAIEGRGA
ncbi:MAG TPA: hypothetical protein VG937_15850 [Polyangiaceae bacterium]|nr:hypothetical protein [Polyangiaceae bacterium]